MNLTLAPRATQTIAGHLVDEEGVGIGDAWVTLRSRSGMVRGRLEEGRSVLTSAEGAFSFSSLLAGEYELQAASSRGVSEPTLVKSGTSSVLLQLGPLVAPGGRASNDRR